MLLNYILTPKIFQIYNISMILVIVSFNFNLIRLKESSMKKLPTTTEARIQNFLEELYSQGEIAIEGFDSNLDAIVYTVDGVEASIDTSNIVTRVYLPGENAWQVHSVEDHSSWSSIVEELQENGIELE